MQKYVNQLIGDIKKSINLAPERLGTFDKFIPDYLNEEDQELFADVEQFMHGSRSTMGFYFGINQMYFPPIEKLNQEQIKELTIYFVQLWIAYNYIPVFPDNLPDKIKYKYLRKYLSYETTYALTGRIHIEFCEYDTENCPFEGYCTICEEIEEEIYTNDDSYYDEDDTDIDFSDTNDYKDDIHTNDDINLPF